jgi:hypothetical protein
MKGKLREGPMKYVTYYWIISLTAYLELSRNCTCFPKLSCVRFLATLAANLPVFPCQRAL